MFPVFSWRPDAPATTIPLCGPCTALRSACRANNVINSVIIIYSTVASARSVNTAWVKPVWDPQSAI